MYETKNLLPHLIAAGVLAMSVSCRSQQPDAARTNATAPTPLPVTAEQSILWSSDPTQDVTDNEPLRRAWRNFESSQKYRLAQPSDRRLSPAAVSRVNSNNPNQIIPFLSWWGAQGYRGSDNKGFLVAIVVDPSRTDPNRYGLVVLAALKSEGPAYKLYWVMQEDDMESYLISPASGSVYIECFRRDGSDEIKKLTWDKKSRHFKLT